MTMLPKASHQRLHSLTRSRWCLCCVCAYQVALTCVRSCMTLRMHSVQRDTSSLSHILDRRTTLWNRKRKTTGTCHGRCLGLRWPLEDAGERDADMTEGTKSERRGDATGGRWETLLPTHADKRTRLVIFLRSKPEDAIHITQLRIWE